jgi:hypothetical protein
MNEKMTTLRVFNNPKILQDYSSVNFLKHRKVRREKAALLSPRVPSSFYVLYHMEQISLDIKGIFCFIYEAKLENIDLEQRYWSE